MAEFKPNPQQQQFLDTLNSNLLVSASAGSGKTSTMIQKLIKILDEKSIPITSILVVTYTNAAASEIKLRLFNELTKLISQVDEVEKKAFLKKQLDNIPNAEIGTLHSICKKLIVKYFYELDESPDFGLVSDKEQKYLLDMAISHVFSDYISSDDNEFFEFFDSYNTKRDDKNLKDLVLKLYDFKVSKTDYNSWKNDFLNNTYSENLAENYACNYILEYYQKQILMFSSPILKLKQEAEDLDYAKYFNFINARYQFINEFNSAINFSVALKVLFGTEFPDKPKRSNKSSVDEQEFDSKVDTFHKSFKDFLKRLKDDFTCDNEEKIKMNIISARKNVEKLLQIIDRVEAQYQTLKKNKNVMDFNDLEEKMLKLLENDSIKSTLKQQYKHVFVDEYQDINDKQELILLNLVSEDNYYMIGDVKQSIYAFRQSSPKIFIDKYNRFLQDNDKNKVIKFNANYRSDRNILEVANSVFDKIITRSTIGIDYASEARFVSEKDYNGCQVSLSIINKDEELEDKDYAEAMLVAREIIKYKQMKKDHSSNYDFSDIAVISRSRGNFVKTLCKVLADNQIPIKTTTKSDFFGTAEISLMISILRVISNSKDDVALTVVLKNLFNITEDELMCIRACNNTIPFCEAVLSYEKEDVLFSKIKECLTFIENSRKFLTSNTIKDYLLKMIDDHDILLKAKSLPNGEEKSNNILDFLKIADSKNYQYNVDKFLDYLNIISKEDTLKIISDSNNAVEICTIHHSKGLEYPIVILAGLGNKYQLNKDSGNIIISGKFGVGLKQIDNINRSLNETIVRNAIKIDNKKSEIDEEIRLLYVAMTRAKEKLALIGSAKIDDLIANKSKNVYATTTSLDMIAKSIPDIYNSNFYSQKQFSIREGELNQLDVKIYSGDEFDNEIIEDKKLLILDAKDDSLMSQLRGVFSSKPEFKTTTIKNTVTNILKEETDYENLNFLPQKLNQTDSVQNIDVLKLGTAYHTVMQDLEFNENLEDIQNLISRLVAENKIEYEYKDLIRETEIKTAIDILGPYIRSSKKVYKEKQFLLCENYNKLVKSTDNNSKVIVQGIIDLVVITDSDEVYLIDYKTNKRVTEEMLAEQYGIQLNLYKHAFEEATGLMVTKKFLYSFSLGKLIEVE